MGAAPVNLPYSFGNAFEAGFRLLTAHYGMVLLVSLIYFFATIINTVVSFVLDSIVPLAGTLVSLAAQFLLLLPLFSGCMWCMVRGLRGQRVDPSGIGRAFERYGQVVAVHVLSLLVILGLILVPSCFLGVLVTAFQAGARGSMGPGGGTAQATMLAAWSILIVGALALLLVVSYVQARLLCASVLVLDAAVGEHDAIMALKRSWKLTGGLVGLSLLALNVVVMILSLLTILLLGVGYLLLGIPVWFTVLSAAYVQLVEPLRASLPAQCQSCGYLRAGLPKQAPCPECGSGYVDPVRQGYPDQPPRFG